MQNGYWRPSTSPWPIQEKMCGDYRNLNLAIQRWAITPDRYSILHIPDLNAQLAGRITFTKIGINQAHYQMKVDEADIKERKKLMSG